MQNFKFKFKKKGQIYQFSPETVSTAEITCKHVYCSATLALFYSHVASYLNGEMKRITTRKF